MMLRRLGAAIRPTSRFLANSRVVAPANLTRKYLSDSPIAREVPEVDPPRAPTSSTLGDSNTPLTSPEEHGLGSDRESRRKFDPKSSLAYLERSFNRFDQKCQLKEEVKETDFVEVFNTLTRTVDKLQEVGQLNDRAMMEMSLHLTTLMRCCGKLMSSTPDKLRELHAGNLWTYMKDKNFPVDISVYNCLLKTLNENNTEFDPRKILEEINAFKLIPDRITYQRLIHQYCMRGDIEEATSLLERMKELGMSLNEQIFASLILCYSKQDKSPSIKELFELMNSNGIEPAGKAYSVAVISLVNSLPTKPENQAELESILNDINKEEIQFNLEELIDILSAVAPHKDNEPVNRLMEHLMKSATGYSSNMRLLRSLASNGLHEQASKLFWSRPPSARAISYGQVGIGFIRVLTEKLVPVEFAINECTKLKQSGYNHKPYHNLFYFAAESGRLDLVREAIKLIAETDEINQIHYWPLIAQSPTEEDLVHTLSNDLKSMNFPNFVLIETFSEWVWPKFKDNFNRLFELNKELNYPRGILVSSLLNFAAREKRINEVIKFISEAPKELLDVDLDNNNEPGYPIERHNRTSRPRPLAAILLDQIAEQTRDVKLVEKAFALCQVPNEAVHSSLAGALVKVHLLNDDLKSAIEVFCKFSRSHNTLPRKAELMMYCLNHKDPDNLQRVMDASSETQGESGALFDLACCCIKLDKIKQATKIMSNKDFRILPARIYRTADTLTNAYPIRVLENYINLAKNIQGVDANILYEKLIQVYGQKVMPDRALELWSKMQEDDSPPSKLILLKLAKVLELNNVRVPFRIPLGDPDSFVGNQRGNRRLRRDN